ncbi:MAG: phosphate ABC transporter permease subunit PstC [Bacteroidota bacterium]|nr:phosphate ABC transporter permease subunit PstC [Bacteroidota bacterium]
MLVHPPLNEGKTFYLSEFLAERSIQAIAFLSIAIILAIFFYVFQEATWAFRDHMQQASSEQPVEDNQTRNSEEGMEEYRPATYGMEEEEYRPATYGMEEEEYRPATYGMEEEEYRPATYGVEEEEYRPATYGVEGSTVEERQRENSISLETSGNNDSVTARQLLLANDTIHGIPEYIWQPVSQVPKYSLVPLFVGALKVTLIGLVIAAPIAILAAIYISMFAPRWMREIMKPAIEILAGFPSVVIGFFALMTLATVVQSITGAQYRLNAFVGGLGMALAVIPIIFTVTEDALSTVPKSMKEASIALGASRWQTAYRVLLPAATPGVFAALILGFGRAFGETMIALMATGNAALVSADIFESVRTMAATIGAEMAEVEFHSVHYGVLFLIGAILFVITFSLNAVAEFFVRKRLLKRFQGT